MGECAGTAAAADGVEWRWAWGASVSAGFAYFRGYEYEVCLKQFGMRARGVFGVFLWAWGGLCGAIWRSF